MYLKEKEICPSLYFKNLLDSQKTNNSINDSTRRKQTMVLSCGKKLAALLKIFVEL